MKVAEFEDLFALLRFLVQFDLGRHRQAHDRVLGVVDIGRRLGIVEGNRAGREGRVFHEETADEVVVVGQSAGRRRIRGQQQAGILDAAGGEHEDLGGDPEAAAIEAGDAHAGNLPVELIRLNIDDIGVQIDRDVFARLELFAKHMAEPSPFLVCLDHPADDLVVRKRQKLEISAVQLSHPDVGVVLADRQAADLVGAIVVGRQLLIGERPAAVGHPRPLGEVDRLKRPGETAPAVGAATEVARSRCVELVGDADALALVQRLGFPLRLEAAAFKETDAHRAADELPREGDAAGAAANHTKVRLDVNIFIDGAGINEHRSSFFPASCNLASSSNSLAHARLAFTLVRPGGTSIGAAK